MAAVTVNSEYTNVDGSMRELIYNITGTTGQTLATGLHYINSVTVSDPTAVTATSVSGGTITFTGTPSSTTVRVTGW